MKTKILLLTILLTISAVAVTMLEQPIQFNAIDLASLTINVQEQYATLTFYPLAVDANGNILAKGKKQPPVKLPKEKLIPVSCMTISELGLTDTNNFAQVLFRVVLLASGRPIDSSFFKWPNRQLITQTNTVETWTWDGTQSNLVTETTITNFYIYK